MTPEAELTMLRAQVLTLSRAEMESRRVSEVSRAELEELRRRGSSEATAALKESLRSEQAARARAESELKRATDELRGHRDRPAAEMEALRALFADLMRSEAHGRRRLEVIQQTATAQAATVRDLERQLDDERESRSRAESQAMDLAAQLRELAPGTEVATDGGEAARLRDRLAQVEAGLASTLKRAGAISEELAEERGRARAQSERAAAEVEWAHDRARAATQAEQEAKDEAAAVRKQLEQARKELEEERESRGESGQKQAAQIAELRGRIEQERELARAELGKREQLLQELRARVSDEALRAREQAIEEETRRLARLRDEAVKAADEVRAQLAAAEEREKGHAPALAREQERVAQAQRQAVLLAEQMAAQKPELDQALQRQAELSAAVRHLEAAGKEQAERERKDRERLSEELTATRTRAEALEVECARAVAGHRTASLELQQEQQRGAQADWERAGLGTELEAAKAAGDAKSRQLAAAELKAAATARELSTVQDGLRVAKERAERDRRAALESETEQVKRLRAEVEKLQAVVATLTPRRKAALAAMEGRYDDAAALLQAAVGSSPQDAGAQLELGRLHFEWPGPRAQGHEAAAEAAFARAAELDRKSELPALLLGNVQRRRGLAVAARTSYREALRRNPASAPAREALELLDVGRARRFAFATLAAAALLFLAGAGLFLRAARLPV